jgi:hypothetical protein
LHAGSWLFVSRKRPLHLSTGEVVGGAVKEKTLLTLAGACKKNQVEIDAIARIKS